MRLLREYIRELLLESQSSSKAIFMAGAPGSGKSTVINSLNLSDSFEIINPDDDYETSKKKNNLPFGIITFEPIPTMYLLTGHH